MCCEIQIGGETKRRESKLHIALSVIAGNARYETPFCWMSISESRHKDCIAEQNKQCHRSWGKLGLKMINNRMKSTKVQTLGTLLYKCGTHTLAPPQLMVLTMHQKEQHVMHHFHGLCWVENGKPYFCLRPKNILG